MKKIFPALMLCIALSGCATSTVIYPSTTVLFQAAQPAPPAWLATDPFDQKTYDHGYINVTAKIVKDPNVACIAPGTSSHFHKDRIDIVVTAIPKGFVNVEPIEIPVYEKHLTPEKSNQCAEPVYSEVLLVPNSVIQSSASPNISLMFRFTGDKEESISGTAIQLLNIASVATTGGAAQTIAGLTAKARSQAYQNLGNAYSTLTSSEFAAPIMQTISWSDLTAGKNEIKMQIWQTETIDQSENPSTAATEAMNGKRPTKHLFDVVFQIAFQRTLFGPAPLSPPFLPDPKTFSDNSVITFPKNAGIGTWNIWQRLNATNPTLTQNLGKADAATYKSACQDMRDNVEALRLTKYDRAIVVAAVLNTARPGWNKEVNFIKDCMQDHLDYIPVLNAIYSRDGYTFIPPPVSSALISPDIGQGENQDWKQEVGPWLRDLILAFKRNNADVRKSRLQTSFIDSTTKISAEPVDWNNSLLVDTQTLDQRLTELARPEISSAGCIMPNANTFESETDVSTYKNPSGSFIAKLTNGDRYVVDVDFDKSTKRVKKLTLTNFDKDGKYDLRIRDGINRKIYSNESDCVKIFASS